MSRVMAVLAALTIFALQISLWPQITTRFLPAFAFAAALAWGIAVSPRTGLWLAGGSGVLLDLYAQHDFGMITLASLAGYGTAWLVLRGYLSGEISWGPVGLGVLAAGAAYELVLLLWSQFSIERFPFLAETFGTATLNVLATSVVCLVALALVSASAGRFSSQRHEKGSLRYR